MAGKRRLGLRRRDDRTLVLLVSQAAADPRSQGGLYAGAAAVPPAAGTAAEDALLRPQVTGGSGRMPGTQGASHGLCPEAGQCAHVLHGEASGAARTLLLQTCANICKL